MTIVEVAAATEGTLEEIVSEEDMIATPKEVEVEEGTLRTATPKEDMEDMKNIITRTNITRYTPITPSVPLTTT